MSVAIIMKILPWVLVVLLVVVGVFLFIGLRNSSATSSMWKSRYENELISKKRVQETIDNILLFQAKDQRIQDQTNDHVETLKKARSNENVTKELARVRDSIIAHYNELRDESLDQ